ncbi:MaoC/PaaZ C-terminal domain-containing protein [Devosia sp. CAU 1758]
MISWLGSFPTQRSFVLSPAQAQGYAVAANDPNPLHQDPTLARALGLDAVPVPGMLIMGLIAEWAQDWPVTVKQLNVRFLAPIGETEQLVAQARVAAEKDEMATIRISVKNGTRLTVLGEAVVSPRRARSIGAGAPAIPR